MVTVHAESDKDDDSSITPLYIGNLLSNDTHLQRIILFFNILRNNHENFIDTGEEDSDVNYLFEAFLHLIVSLMMQRV